MPVLEARSLRKGPKPMFRPRSIRRAKLNRGSCRPVSILWKLRGWYLRLRHSCQREMPSSFLRVANANPNGHRSFLIHKGKEEFRAISNRPIDVRQKLLEDFNAQIRRFRVVFTCDQRIEITGEKLLPACSPFIVR